MNFYQNQYLTILYYYDTLLNNKIIISNDITDTLFSLNYYDITDIHISILRNLNYKIKDILSNSKNIIYDDDLTDDNYLLKKYKNYLRLNKLNKIL